jgi:hypothetical protein
MTHAVAAVVPDKKAFHELEKEAIRLVHVVESSYLEIGKVLGEIRNIFKSCLGKPGLAQKTLGFDTFEEWVDGKLGFVARKAYQLLGIERALRVDTGIPQSQLETVGWTKARELVVLADKGVLTKANSKEWLEDARTMNTDDLKAKVKNALAEKGAPKVETLHRVVFGLFDGQLDNVKAALETAQEITGTNKTGNALDAICLEYNASHIRGKDTKEAVVARIGAKLQEVFGVTVIVVDKGEKSILFGKEEAESLDKS